MKRVAIYATLAAATVVGLWWAKSGDDKVLGERFPKSSRLPPPSEVPAESAHLGDIETPKLFRVSGYPPANAEEARLWAWWKHIEKVNPKWEWERSINFYGVVEDDKNRPVPNARVILEWSALDGTPRMDITSDERGRFQLEGARGKGLTVSIQKPGYHATKQSRASFEYAAFWERNFHVPNPEKPVVFRLHVQRNPEPLIVWTVAKEIRADGKPYQFDFESGTFGSRGALTFIITRTNEKGTREFDFTVQIRVADGGGLAISDDDVMFEAPSSEYVPEWRTDKVFGKPNYSQVDKVKLYVRTPQGKYAAVRAQIAQMADPEAQVQLSVFYNPSGSRNLEYDADQRLNR